ncbi:hypothetical protein GCM10025768_12860 [Microbacterium pseudoresistens]|uniref:ABC3 transporter permease C-terminal domain-containing protein n=1 Tax=Microbacterium pseudoresistens TaxID=640634 RepID=A0A7Y9EWM5_9MICO|nr:FtsX-like permease family protein [Microbacterium pseudoresistens]NYD55189.1 hypothetical protein [Microbacterium pseudoresistens]
MTFAVRRAAVHAGRLALLALVAALVVGGIGAIDALAERMLDDGASHILADAEPDARTLRVVAAQSADAGQQDAQVRQALADVADRAGLDEPAIVVSRLVSLTVDGVPSGGDDAALRLVDEPRAPDLATLSAGAWPRTPQEFALPTAAAQRGQLQVGDEVTLTRDGTTLTLVGTWEANDPADPAWHGDPSVSSGENDGVMGPAVIADGALAQLPGTPTATWEIAPRTDDTANRAALQRAITAVTHLPDAIDPQRSSNMRILGGLDRTVQRQASAVAATRGLLVAPLLIIALLGALVLGIVLATLASARRTELALLRARGASARRLGLDAAGEAALVVAVGAALALAGLGLTVGVTALALVTAAAVLALVVAGAAVFAARAAVRSDAVREESVRNDAGSRTFSALLLPAGVAAILGALSAWQLFATGSVVTPDGAPEPLAAAAPALLLVAGCALAPVIAGPLAALLERLLRSTRGIAPLLPLRQVARRMGVVAVAILCLGLATASAAVAVAAPAVTGAAEQKSLDALLGADVRMIAADGLDATAETVATWPGVTAADEILRNSVTVGSDSAVLVAGPPGALGLGAALSTSSGQGLAVAITRSLADRLGARDGTVFTARVRSVARPATFEVVRIVESLPSIGDRLGMAVDPATLAEIGDLAPNELWVRSSTPEQTAADLRAQATHPARILTAAQVSAAPVTGVAPALLIIGALVAVVLGVIGFVAASSAAASARREEPTVLRALGLSPSQHRALRAGETALVAVYAAVAGAVVGAVVAAVVLPVVLGAAS